MTEPRNTPTVQPVRVAGVDGTRGGWVAVVLERGRLNEIRLFREVETDFEELAGVEVIAIDIPIGFGPREADKLARGAVGGSTVFAIPEESKFSEPFGPGRGISTSRSSTRSGPVRKSDSALAGIIRAPARRPP